MKFKTWLIETLNSAGNNTNPTGTVNAAQDAAQAMMDNPKFAADQAKWTASGSPSNTSRHLMQTVATDFKAAVPAQIAPLTNPAATAGVIGQSLGLKNLKLPSIKTNLSAMKKGMSK
jgi:hypothetical protein